MKNPVIQYILNNQIIAALLIIGLALFLIQIRGIIIGLFIAFIIMSALSPFVNMLRKRGLPNILSVSITYFSAFLILALIIFPLIPFFISQIQSLFQSLPNYIDQTSRLTGFNIDSDRITDFVASEINSIGNNAVAITGRVFGGFFTLLTVLVISFYLLLDRSSIKRSLVRFFPKEYHRQIEVTAREVEEKLGEWLRGQIILSLFIGVITYIALSLVGLEFALPLALLAGLLEIIPTLGPIIAAVPAVIVALSVSPALALAVVLIYIAIQIIENNVLVPSVMRRAVGLNPIVIMLGIIIGGRLMGIAGALLSVPFISLLVVVGKSLREEESTD